MGMTLEGMLYGVMRGWRSWGMQAAVRFSLALPSLAFSALLPHAAPFASVAEFFMEGVVTGVDVGGVCTECPIHA